MNKNLSYIPNNFSFYSNDHINDQNSSYYNNNFHHNHSSKSLNSYKLKLYNKDKAIMNYTNQINQQNQKIEGLVLSLEQKNKDISNLENTIKDLNQIINSQKNEDYKNKEIINKFKLELDNEIQINENNKNNYDNNYFNICQKLESSNLKIKDLEQMNINLKNDLNKLQKEFYSQTEIIENQKLMNNKLSDENQNIPLLNKKIIEQNNSIKLLSEENSNLKKYNQDILNENKKLNQKLNQLFKETTEKENSFNITIYDTNSKLSEINKENQNILDELQKYKQKNEEISQIFEKYCNFVNQKLNELNDFIITAFNTGDLMKLSDEINYYSQNKGVPDINDIKFELVENTIFEMKKNSLKHILNIKEKNCQYMNELNNISREKDVLESHNNEIINELNIYKQNQIELENVNKELELNFEELKQTYTKLYNDYNTFTNSNSKYVNDTQNFYLEIIEKIKNILEDKAPVDKEKGLNQILNEYIETLIYKYNILKEKNEENDRNEKLTCKKMLELSNLLEESQKYLKKYENENINLREENSRINYRYNLLKASIDIVEKNV